MTKPVPAMLAMVVTLCSALCALAATPVSIEAAVARENRVALVVGNAHYAASPLANPVNDARSMAAALKSMGFRVTLVEDGSMATMVDAVRTFGSALKPGGVGLFFYAGHGMQIKGRNYLIPVGADIQREDEVAFNAFDANQILERMEAAKSRVNIVILDACRNNPFTRSFRSASQGLASMDAPVGSYVAMATAPGRVAGDGADGNGTYTKNLLVAMKTPGLAIEDVFKRTRVKVMAATENQQVPWDYSSLSGNFYFIPSEAAAIEMASAALPPLAPKPASAPSLSAPSTSAPSTNAPSLSGRLASAVPSMSAAPSTSAASALPAGVKPDRLAPPHPTHDRDVEAAVAGADNRQSAEAAYELGLQYKIGRKPVAQDLPRALKLFVEAAQKGHAGAQYEAAQAYAQGVGTAKRCKDALGWAQKAAKAGTIEAAVLAGDLNRTDCAGSRNLAESARWYRIAADKGAPSAQFALGVLYLNGEGVSKDVGQARRWLAAAAGQGNASARFYLDRLPR